MEEITIAQLAKNLGMGVNELGKIVNEFNSKYNKDSDNNEYFDDSGEMVVIKSKGFCYLVYRVFYERDNIDFFNECINGIELDEDDLRTTLRDKKLCNETYFDRTIDMIMGRI